ncbi:MAG: IclR family transcriptional regulator [Deltaproteobacteria bacterium]|nr:IclR family transcriptional regulator [Deltaproteobacteria bacterium]
MKTGYSTNVPAVEQAARLLLALSRQVPAKMNLTDLCRKVGIHKSKGYAVLNTLQAFGFIQRDGDGKRYGLGPGLIALGRSALDNLNFKEVVDPFLAGLAQETGSPAFFGVLADQQVFVIAKNEGDGRFGLTIRLGQRYPVSHGAHGKAIAAFLPEAERKTLLDQEKLFFHGDPARLDRRRLERELSRCRREGYAEDPGDMHPQIQALAAPVFSSGGRLTGVLFVTGLIPKNRMKPFGRKVAENARAVSRLLGAEVEEAS